MTKVTVVIPVYNAEKYLTDCLDSVVNQTLADIELIVVNDGSTDESEAIIEEFLAKDSRVKYFPHQENQGQAMARNTGLAVAKGTYICFLDADDKLEPTGLEVMYDLAVENDLEILEGRYALFSTTSKPKESAGFNKTCQVFEGRKIFEVAYRERYFFMMPVWKRIWKHSFLKEIDFQFSNMYHEELIPLLNSYLHSTRVMYTDFVFYSYRMGDGSSITSGANPKQVEDFFKVSDFLEGLIEKEGFSSWEKSFFKRRLASTMKILFKRFSCLGDQHLVEFDSYLKNKRSYFFSMNTSPRLVNLMFYVGCMHPSLLRKLLRLLSAGKSIWRRTTLITCNQETKPLEVRQSK